MAYLKPAAHSALISTMNVMTASGSDGVTIGAGSPCLWPAGRLPHHVLCPWTVGFLSLSLWPLGRVRSALGHTIFSPLRKIILVVEA